MSQVFSPKKITIRDCGLSKKQLEETAKSNPGQTVVLRFVGVVSDAKTEEGTVSPYTVLTGDFGAVNLLSGDSYSSRKAILPEVATMPILDLLAEGRKNKGSVVKCAVDIAVTEFTPRNPDGLKYKFVAAALIKPTRKTVVDEILEEIGLPPMISDQRSTAKKGKKK